MAKDEPQTSSFWASSFAVVKGLPVRYILVLLLFAVAMYFACKLYSESGNRPVASVMAIDGLILFSTVVLCMLILRMSGKSNPTEEAGGEKPQAQESDGRSSSHLVMTWQREVTKLDIPEAATTKLTAILVAVRQKSAEYLAKHGGEVLLGKISERHVRANIFLFHYKLEASGFGNDHVDDDGVWAGEAGVLVMPRSLQVGMKGHPDIKMEFRPYNGATGHSFMTGGVFSTTPAGDPREATSWTASDVDQRLTREQLSMLHPRLKWLITTPIKDLTDSCIYAVMNVDGIEFEIDGSTLEGLQPIVANHALQAAAVFRELPRVRLVIGYQP